MHVLQFASWYPENSEDVSGSFFREFANGLKKSGVKIGVLHAKFIDGLFNKRGVSLPTSFNDENGVVVGRSTTRIRIPGPTRRIPTLERRDVEIRLQAGRVLYDEYVAKHGRPDILHAQACFWGGVIASKIAEEKGHPIVVSAHSSVFGRGLVGKRERLLAYDVWRNSTQNISVSRMNAKIISDMFDLPENSFQIIPNGVDSEQFVVTPMPTLPFKWICIGNLVKNKRVDLLLDAMKAMPPDHVLTIVGDGPMKSQLIRQSVDLDGRVSFLGTVERERVPQLISESHALVHPSEFETFGVVLVEAMMCGRPVVAMRCGGPEDIIDSTTGRLIQNGNVKELIGIMKEVSKITWDPKSIAEYAQNLFDEKNILSRFEKIYSDVITKYNEKNN